MTRLILFAVIACLAFSVQAQERSISMIRDAESEALLREIAKPIFLEAGLVPQNINIYIINSSVLNAFVAGGQNMFLHTGLLTWSDDPNVVAGVIAHETGHIAGGHLVRMQEDLESASIGAIASMILGAATIVAGAPDAGSAILTGGNHIAQSSALRYTRSKEESADQAAVRYMDKLGISLEGLIKLLEELNSQQRRQFEDINPYALTHPLSTERIQFLRSAMANSKSFTEPAPQAQKERYARMVAKIVAFIEDPAQVRRRYPASDNSMPAQMARAILAHRAGDTKTAVAVIDNLLTTNERDGFLYELKGQFLFEGGNVKSSITAYARAEELLPEEPLITLGLGSAYLADGQTDAAITALKKVTLMEKENALAWRQLGIAYGKAGKTLESYAALAEEAVLRKDAPTAKRFIALAKPLADHNGIILLRLNDMEQQMAQWKDKE